MAEIPDLSLIKGAFEMARMGLGSLREAQRSVESSLEREVAEEKLAEAERTLDLAEGQVAKALGYKLCQCVFPPQIMLSQGLHHKYNSEVFKCPECGRQDPPEKHFEWLDENERRRRPHG